MFFAAKDGKKNHGQAPRHPLRNDSQGNLAHAKIATLATAASEGAKKNRKKMFGCWKDISKCHAEQSEASLRNWTGGQGGKSLQSERDGKIPAHCVRRNDREAGGRNDTGEERLSE